MSEREINQPVADQICSTGRLNGKLFQLGECVALLDGKVVRDLKGALSALRSLDPDPRRGMLLTVGPQVDLIR